MKFFGSFRVVLIFLPQIVFALPNVSMEVDRTIVTEGETVSLKYIVRSEERLQSVEQPKFRATDFEEVNEFTADYNESFYENGRFGMRRRRQITKVLRPKRSGNLVIGGLSLRVNGRSYTAPSIRVTVKKSGSQVNPYRQGQRGAQSRTGRKAKPFFLQAEVPQQSIYKGEQLTVSYYLYRSVALIDAQVKKFPVLKGFLREDLEMPILGRRLDADTVVVDGLAYQKSLVARYAAYALTEGELEIDPIALKIHYQPRGKGQMGHNDDPFLRFFRQMTPRASSIQSDPVKIKVKSLPISGRPVHFAGAVGDFSVASSIDRYRLSANEALTFRLKVEGRGNAAAIRTPEVQWPDGVDLYETKGQPRSSDGGISEKVFEYLLIPRRAGNFTLPAVELSYFDPNLETFLTVSTEPFSIEVMPAKGAAAASDTQGQVAPLVAPSGGGRSLRSQVNPLESLPNVSPWSGLLSGFTRFRFVWLLLWLLALLGLQVLRTARQKAAHRRSLTRVRPKTVVSGWKSLLAASKNPSDVAEMGKHLRNLVNEELHYWSGQSVRSMPSGELLRFLEKTFGVDSDEGVRLVKGLEAADAWKYSPVSGSGETTVLKNIQQVQQVLEKYQPAFRAHAENKARNLDGQ